MPEKSEFKKHGEGRDRGPAMRLWHGRAATSKRQTTRMTRRFTAVLALAAIFCGSGIAYGQNNKNKQKDKGAETNVSSSSLLPDNRAVDLLVSQMLGAWQAGDADALRKFYADDVLVVSGAWEQPIIGWANYSNAYQAQFKRTTGPRLERTNSYTRAMGDTAWATYQWRFVGEVDGKPAQALGHTTLVLQKRAGNWFIVLNHTSAVPTDEPVSANPAARPNGQPTSSLAPNAR